MLKQAWPWYVSGPLIGLMVPALLIFANRHFGISTSFRHICAACIPTKQAFFNYDWKKESWMLFLAAGIAIGGYVGGVLLKSPDAMELSENARENFTAMGMQDFTEMHPRSVFAWDAFLSWQGWLFMALGGFLIGFGTRWANGCTAGHAIMGLSLLSPGSLVAVIGFFIGGLFVSHLVLPYLF